MVRMRVIEAHNVQSLPPRLPLNPDKLFRINRIAILGRIPPDVIATDRRNNGRAAIAKLPYQHPAILLRMRLLTVAAQRRIGLGIDDQHPGILARSPLSEPAIDPTLPQRLLSSASRGGSPMRPLGVTLIAVWFWLRSALGILLGLGMAVAGGLAGRAMHALSAGTALPAFLSGLGTFLGIAIA